MAVTPNSIVTPQTPKSGQAATSAAQATFPPTTTPANTVLLITAGPNGSRVTRIRAAPQATIVATHLQLFRSSDAGVTKNFVQGVLMPATTVSATSAAVPADFGYSDDNPLILAANERVYVATAVATGVNYDAEWSDY